MKRLLIENVRGIVFLIGAGWLYHGIAGMSQPAANIAGGLLLMAVGAYPYLRLKRKG